MWCDQSCDHPVSQSIDKYTEIRFSVLVTFRQEKLRMATKAKSKRGPRRVCFQTSTDESVEQEAMRTFLIFESGDSGNLSFHEFREAVQRLGLNMQDKQVWP